MSPVSLINPIATVQYLNKFEADSHAQTLGAMIRIIYDKQIGRPWGLKYYEVANRRWQALAKILCAQPSPLCLQPIRLKSSIDLVRVLSGFNSNKGLRALYTAFGSQGEGSYGLERVEYPSGYPAIPFSFLLASQEQDKVENQVHVWNMSASEIHNLLAEYIEVPDLKDYAEGFSGDPSPDIFLLTKFRRPDTIVYVIDNIKSVSAKLADTWQFQEKLPIPSLLKTNPLLYFDQIIWRQLYRDYQNQFAKIERGLKHQLEAMNSQAAKSTLERFNLDQAAGQYPQEVYQWASYALVMQMLHAQGVYFRLAADQRMGVPRRLKLFESILTAQAKADPKFLMFMSLLEFDMPGSTPLCQFMPTQDLLAYMLENLQAMLDLGRYKGQHNFARYEYVFHGTHLLDAEYLQKNNPVLYGKLLNRKTGKLRDVSKMSTQEQKKIYQEYLAPGGKLKTSGLLRLMISVAINIKRRDASHLAKVIHRTESALFQSY